MTFESTGLSLAPVKRKISPSAKIVGIGVTQALKVMELGASEEYQDIMKEERTWPSITYSAFISRIKIVSFPGAVRDQIAAKIGGCFWQWIIEGNLGR